jgi:hypothetical protein
VLDYNSTNKTRSLFSFFFFKHLLSSLLIQFHDMGSQFLVTPPKFLNLFLVLCRDRFHNFLTSKIIWLMHFLKLGFHLVEAPQRPWVRLEHLHRLIHAVILSQAGND